jgi:Clostripain family
MTTLCFADYCKSHFAKLLLVLCASLMPGFLAERAVLAAPACHASNAGPGVARWTILVFMNGDNNLEPDALINFRQLAKVGSSSDIKVVVQFDRIAKYAHTQPDWPQTLRFLVSQGTKPLPSDAIQDIGEADMGDPKVLSDFVKWGCTSYPAEHYMLVIWDHGQGWRFFTGVLLAKQRAMIHSRALAPVEGAQAQLALSATLRSGFGAATDTGLMAPLSSAPSGGYRSASNDETNNDVLYNSEIEDGLKDALGGEKLDVIAFDACLMSMVETGYALRDVGKVFIGSEELVPGLGWAYDDFLSSAESQQPSDAAAMAKLVVDSYRKTYETISPDTTLAAIDLSQIVGVASKISAVADLLSNNIQSTAQSIATARNSVQTYAPGYQFYHVDMIEFLNQMRKVTTDPKLVGSIDATISMINSAVIANYAGTDRQGAYGSHGLAIYFPARGADHLNDPFAEGGYEKGNKYYPVQFVDDFHWSDFLHKYWTEIP